MNFVEKSAKTIDEAVKLALEELKLEMKDVKVEVLEQPSKGIFGLIGQRAAKVRVEVLKIEPKQENAAPTRETQERRNSSDKPSDRTKEKEAANKFLRDVLNSMDIKAEIKIRFVEEGMYINLVGPKMGMVIGRRGQTLDSLQYLVSLVVNKDNDKGNYVKVVLDTEDYRRKREETLNRLAKRLADKVIKSGKKVELEPMNPYERRIIHSALQNYSQIYTYSEGEEPFRKVIIAQK